MYKKVMKKASCFVLRNLKAERIEPAFRFWYTIEGKTENLI